jgi:Ni/Co efflux regulator RcnB
VEQELPTIPKHLGSPLVFSGARVSRSLVLKKMYTTENYRLMHLRSPPILESWVHVAQTFVLFLGYSTILLLVFLDL